MMKSKRTSSGLNSVTKLTLLMQGRTQDFLHVSDAARGIVDAAASEATGVYNLASGVATSMLELTRTVTAFPGWNVAVIDRGGVDAGPSVSVDISRARQAWGFRPMVTLRDGIATYHAALSEGPAEG